MGDIRIHSDDNKEWVNNAAKELSDFYGSKKTWFAGIKRGMAPLSILALSRQKFLRLLSNGVSNE